jgi:hypothetical protein
MASQRSNLNPKWMIYLNTSFFRFLKTKKSEKPVMKISCLNTSENAVVWGKSQLKNMHADGESWPFRNILNGEYPEESPSCLPIMQRLSGIPPLAHQFITRYQNLCGCVFCLYPHVEVSVSGSTNYMSLPSLLSSKSETKKLRHFGSSINTQHGAHEWCVDTDCLSGKPCHSAL